MSLNVPDFSNVRILVAGDLMLDQYWFGPTSRISPEAPVPVVKVKKTTARAGGAANVAVNLSSLGASTTIAGIVGDDPNGLHLAELLDKLGVHSDLCKSLHPTITKLRVLSRNQQLIRLDTEDEYSTVDAEELSIIIDSHLDGQNVCILSDYAKGSLGDIPALVALCHKHAVPVLADPKGIDFDIYRGVTVLTPNLSEFEAVAGPSNSDAELFEKAQALRAALDITYLIVTLSERGMMVISEDSEPEMFPAKAREVFDVTGAGDTVIATLAAGIGAGLNISEAAALANLAASLVVAKIGVASVTTDELRLALHEQGQGGRGLLTQEQAAKAVREAQSRGEKVVMTNGCFDILHPGHVSYLQEAKARGHRLIVAVNSDESVKALKGEDRPINPLEDRMAVLAGLASVDWVVGFEEETPERLISEVLPNVLVKGGDYLPEQIAGGRAVLENGGSVEVLGFLEGRSTSSILDAIRK
ncbi:MAG: bifunctional D-glycero-beta-D-manno-heptose-7-phosphate kinase/D-glycero-beta-D-manno-heptose 1-phosphate adenylyltransferase HldE [Gammaproteobacteria bacterium]|nr:bifunctional D-glycero-beta-D-manno-heptose-7-phosphate kinase/D-glycero-beta-D-manno-heptose 1-phosphate adenylyltransferase HldE [Gammaproteobacteria bacterium]